VPNKIFLEKSIHNMGARILHEKLSFQLTGWPKDKSQKLEDLQQKIFKILDRKDHLRVYTDIKNHKLSLNVEYLVGFDVRLQLRSDVIDLAVEGFGDVVYFSK
jgi:hypothetical protein